MRNIHPGLAAIALLLTAGCAATPPPSGAAESGADPDACTARCETIAQNCAVACSADGSGSAGDGSGAMVCQSNCGAALGDCQKRCQ